MLSCDLCVEGAAPDMFVTGEVSWKRATLFIKRLALNKGDLNKVCCAYFLEVKCPRMCGSISCKGMLPSSEW